MSPERLDELLNKFSRMRIAVIGDFFLDKYLDVDPCLEEPSVETGKIAHQVVAIRCSPGAAGTVVNNLAALDVGSLHAIGAIGDDGEAFELLRELTRRGCTADGLSRFAGIFTPTYLKPRNQAAPGLAGEHSRYDTKNRRPMDSNIEDAVLQALDRVLPEIDGVIIADQVNEENCGVITARVRDGLAERALRFPNVVFWADSRRKISEFRHVWIKPNQFEAVEEEHPQPGESIPLERLLTRISELQSRDVRGICATLGERGAVVCETARAETNVDHPAGTEKPVCIRGVRLEEPIDTTGAGDSFTAGAVLSLCAGANLREAALVGILVSSITVQQLATTGVASREAVRKRLSLWQHQAN